jgi:hypothetical protein
MPLPIAHPGTLTPLIPSLLNNTTPSQSLCSIACIMRQQDSLFSNYESIALNIF